MNAFTLVTCGRKLRLRVCFALNGRLERLHCTVDMLLLGCYAYALFLSVSGALVASVSRLYRAGFGVLLYYSVDGQDHSLDYRLALLFLLDLDSISNTVCYAVLLSTCIIDWIASYFSQLLYVICYPRPSMPYCLCIVLYSIKGPHSSEHLGYMIVFLKALGGRWSQLEMCRRIVVLCRPYFGGISVLGVPFIRHINMFFPCSKCFLCHIGPHVAARY